MKGIAILKGLKVRGNGNMLKGILQFLLKILRQMMGIMHGHLSRHQHVHGNKAMRARLPRLQGVKLNIFLTISFHDLLDHGQLLFR